MASLHIDEGLSSTLQPAPQRRRVGDEVGVEVPLVANEVVPPPVAEKVVSGPQDDNGSDDEGNDNHGSGRDDGDGEGSGRDDGEGKAMHIPFRTTPSGIMWFKCPVCLGDDDVTYTQHHMFSVFVHFRVLGYKQRCRS
jgi:hypothetical protein